MLFSDFCLLLKNVAKAMSVLKIKTISGQIQINLIISISKKARNRRSARFSEKQIVKKPHS
jgi:hypothetical protein